MSSEPQQIIKEYQSFFHSIQESPNDPQVLRIITLENIEMDVEFSNNGWIFNNFEIFEIFENGMMLKSEGFKRKFHNVLYDKLSKLEEVRDE